MGFGEVGEKREKCGGILGFEDILVEIENIGNRDRIGSMSDQSEALVVLEDQLHVVLKQLPGLVLG